MILLHDAPSSSHTAKLVKETIEAFGWEILSHAGYSPFLGSVRLPYTYLHRWDTHLLSKASDEDVRKRLDDLV